MSRPAVVVEHEVETVSDEGPRPRPLGAAQPAAAVEERVTIVAAPVRRDWRDILARITPAGAAEFVLLALLALQCARLVWTLATPLGPVGAWTAPVPVRTPAAAAAPAPLDFDPFFRTAPASGIVVVTSLPLTLHGVREDRATGRGSAIIGTPDGEQNSVAVGEEIMPGVTLTAVGFDSVTISRGGTAEQIFLGAAPPAEAAPAAPQGQGR